VYEKGPVFLSLNAVVLDVDDDLLSLDSVLSEKYSLFFETLFVTIHESNGCTIDPDVPNLSTRKSA